MFEASPLGIALIDSISYEYRDINARYQEILGRSQHELRALRWLEVGHPDDVVQIKAQMALLITQQISSFKALSRLFRPDGSVAWIDVSVNAIDTESGGHRTTCA
jgi:PAS domain S-box-containing protein